MPNAPLLTLTEGFMFGMATLTTAANSFLALQVFPGCAEVVGARRVSRRVVSFGFLGGVAGGGWGGGG